MYRYMMTCAIATQQRANANRHLHCRHAVVSEEINLNQGDHNTTHREKNRLGCDRDKEDDMLVTAAAVKGVGAVIALPAKRSAHKLADPIT
jgi:hypothetical protein